MINQSVNEKSDRSSIKPFIEIARLDNWFKQIFTLPGVVFAVYDLPELLSWNIIPTLLLALLAICLVASSNYTINEILDATTDRLHPVKKNRPVPSGLVNLKVAYTQWILLGLTGLVIGWQINLFFFLSLLSLLIMGLLYNIPPFRLKDLPYLDVLSESINNPIRLLLGWFVVNDAYPPTSSLIMAYWMIGAFFMSVKRYAEYMRIGNALVAEKYRKSFSYYNQYRLILNMVYYASAFGLFFGIFLVRYRIELILSVPFLAGFITMYMRLGFLEDSPAQYPERLYKQKGLVLYTSFFLILIFLLLFIDIPIVDQIFQPYHMPGE